MVQEVYAVHLTAPEKGLLKKMIRAGRHSTQAITRARILLKTDEGWAAPQVSTALDVSERTVRRVKRRYVEEGLEEVLRHHNSPNSIPEGGRPCGSPPDCLGLQPGAGEPRSLDAAGVGRQGGGVGTGGILVVRDGAAAPEETSSSRGVSSSGVSPR